MSAFSSHLYLMSGVELDRAAYGLLIESELGWRVTQSGFEPAQVCAILRREPNVVMLDAEAAIGPAADCAHLVTRLRPAARVLVLSATAVPAKIRTWRGCRIHGLVLKEAGLADLKAALAALRNRGEFYSHGVREVLAGPKTGGLSRRESELLLLLARGMRLRDAARQMTVSYKTADTFRSNLLRKLKLPDRVALAHYAIRERIIEA